MGNQKCMKTEVQKLIMKMFYDDNLALCERFTTPTHPYIHAYEQNSGGGGGGDDDDGDGRLACKQNIKYTAQRRGPSKLKILHRNKNRINLLAIKIYFFFQNGIERGVGVILPT